MTKEDFHRLLIAPSTRLLLDRMQADNARVDAALKAAEARRPVTTDELFERR